MENQITDTSESAEKILIEGYRNMPVHKKMEQVTALTQMVQRNGIGQNTITVWGCERTGAAVASCSVVAFTGDYD